MPDIRVITINLPLKQITMLNCKVSVLNWAVGTLVENYTEIVLTTQFFIVL